MVEVDTTPLLTSKAQVPVQEADLAPEVLTPTKNDDPNPSEPVESDPAPPPVLVSSTNKSTRLTETLPSSSPSTSITLAGTKRQLSLTDMFASKARPAASIVNKKPRLSVDRSKSTTLSSPSSSASSFSTKTSKSKPVPINSIPFSLSTFQSSLSATPSLPSNPSSPSERDLLRLECDTMGKSWLKVLKEEIRKPYFLDLKRFLWIEGVRGKEDSDVGKVFPPARDVYAWSRYTPLDRIRVVIIGQDPYHNVGQAHGLCFSVQPGVTIPGSLRNIYTEIKSSYPTEFSQPPKHGHLLPWARSGVLLLNTSLTVKAHQAGSHSNKGWETFTDRVVELVDLYGGAGLGGDKVSTGGVGAGVVFLAWGAWAAKRVAKLDKKKHLILTSAHPSPLSAHRGFLGNGHFKKANEWLEEKYGETGPVEWWKLDLETAVS